jgi:acyl-CoA reductase-like NAD-dependent aldehyde dehydrogenase
MSSFLVRSPSDLRVQLGVVEPTPVEPIVTQSALAFPGWSRTSFETRVELLTKIEAAIRENAATLARAIAMEVGKTINEADEELRAVPGVFKQTFLDAEEYHFDAPVIAGTGTEHAEIRRSPRGPVAVIGPYNFPVLMPLRSIVPYLLAGNTVVFKASPMSALVGDTLSKIFKQYLPDGVFTLVQGGSDERQQLCTDERIRSISFSGNLIAAREVMNAVALDFSKNLALETGGKNALILLEDGDVAAAAKAAAVGICSVAGQRSDSTSRAIVHYSKVEAFSNALVEELKRFVPGDPLNKETTMGVLVNESAHKRYADALDTRAGTWILRGDAMYQNEGRPGYYVKPSVRLWPSFDSGLFCPIMNNEIYAPIVDVFAAQNDLEIITLNNATTYGNAASIFTSSRERFENIGRELRVGNIYANLPTIHSHTWLPSCGRRNSNNGKSFGRGFIRYAANELSVRFGGGI